MKGTNVFHSSFYLLLMLLLNTTPVYYFFICSFLLLYWVIFHGVIVSDSLAVGIEEFAGHQERNPYLFVFFFVDIDQVFCKDMVVATFLEASLCNIEEA